MAGENDDSVTVWIASLKVGDADAAEKLWQRYFETLVRLARDRLRGAPRTVADEEDAALNAFDSFVRGAARGRYPRLHDRDDLWRLLVVITERKASYQARRERRQKRGGGKSAACPVPRAPIPSKRNWCASPGPSRRPSSPLRWPTSAAASSTCSAMIPSASSRGCEWRVLQQRGRR